MVTLFQSLGIFNPHYKLFKKQMRTIIRFVDEYKNLRSD